MKKSAHPLADTRTPVVLSSLTAGESAKGAAS